MVKTREKGEGGVLWLIISEKLYSPSRYDQLKVNWSVSWVRNQSSWQSTKCFNCPQTLEEAHNFSSFFVFLSFTSFHSVVIVVVLFFFFFLFIMKVGAVDWTPSGFESWPGLYVVFLGTTIHAHKRSLHKSL